MLRKGCITASLLLQVRIGRAMGFWKNVFISLHPCLLLTKVLQRCILPPFLHKRPGNGVWKWWWWWWGLSWRRKGKGRPAFGSFSFSSCLLCFSVVWILAFRDMWTFKICSTSMKAHLLVGGAYLSGPGGWRHCEEWGDSGGDPYVVGGFPISRIVPSFSSLIQV